LGFQNEPMELDLTNDVIFKGAKVYGITGRRMFQTWYQMKGLLEKPGFRRKMAALITHRLPIKDVAKGMDLINSKQAAKVVLELKWE